MTLSSDSRQNENTAHAVSSVKLPRLFHFDLAELEQTGNTLPELGDVSALQRVLDIASGNGEWAMRVAPTALQTQVVGIDADVELIGQARTQAEAKGVGNVSFTAMDPFQPLKFDEGTFDLVNARFLAGQLLVSAWPQLLTGLVRITRPDGVVRLLEGELPITNSPALAKLDGMLSDALYQTKRSFSPYGRLLSITPTLKHLLQDAGCQNVQQRVAVTNFSADKPAHAQLSQDMATTYRLVQPFLIEAGVTTPEEVEQVYQQMLSELQAEDFLAVAFWLTVWGNKP
ncbi:MAG: class I SAM-dependent methyltransferase [Ktedonobacteraceae bacterium]